MNPPQGQKTNFWAIVFLIATTIAANPSLVGALDPQVKAWITTCCGVISACAGAMGFWSAKDKDSPATLQAKAEDRIALKEEIKEAAKIEAVDHIVSVLPTVLPAALPTTQAITIPSVTIDATNVNVESKPEKEKAVDS